MTGMTKRELIALVRAGGLEVDGSEDIAELSEAIGYLVQAWKICSARAETAEILADPEAMAAIAEADAA